LDAEDFKAYFASLLDDRSWSLVKIERSALQFFFAHVLKREWAWVDMLRPPVVRSLPDVLSIEEIAQIIVLSRERRYQTFWLTAYSMGLRLGETLRLQTARSSSKSLIFALAFCPEVAEATQLLGSSARCRCETRRASSHCRASSIAGGQSHHFARMPSLPRRS
jgi:hypothetical protein